MRSVLLLVANLLAFSSAVFSQHYYYAPNSIHIPALTEKKNGSAGLGIGWGGDYIAAEVQGIYSPYPHAAIMLNGFITNSGAVRRNEEEGSGLRFLELGLGAYQKLERGSASIFAGVGQGGLYSFYGLEKYSRFTLRRYFLQPGLMYQNKLFRCGLALRLSRISYPKGESAFDIDQEELTAIRKIEEDAPFFLPELGLSGGIVLGSCFLAFNLTSVFPDVPGLNFSRFNTGLMLTVEFGKSKTIPRD